MGRILPIVAREPVPLASSMNPPKPEVPEVRKGQGDVQLDRAEFERRFREQFFDPAFRPLEEQIRQLADVAWDGYVKYRKSPVTRRAGEGFADPDYEISTAWLAARDAISEAERIQRDSSTTSRVLLICAAARSDQTCPGEMSKTFRMLTLAREVLERERIDVDVLDLSHETSQYGRRILPCKGCVSTAMPLCHWPCSCYPNYAMGQVNDWMNELYPRFVAAHGIMIVTPVYWYQAPAVLKPLMDRLVCADGGNPDPTSTHGKDPRLAKQLELDGWDYPRHLAGRAFAVVVHGDAAGTENLRRMLVDWLTDMRLVPAGPSAEIDRYIGYYQSYAESHVEFDRDTALHEEIRNAARALAMKINSIRSETYLPEMPLPDPRPK
jgi:multimeric flavodoxin WrbA